MIRESMWLSTSSGGMEMPDPASTARAWVMRKLLSPGNRMESESFGRQHRLLMAQTRIGPPGDVRHRQVASLDETVERRGLSAVEPGRRGRIVRPGLDRRLVARRGDLEIGLARRAVDHEDRAPVGAPAAEPGFGEHA